MSNLTIPHNIRQRHRQVRAHFISRGTSLNEWCRKNAVKRQNADKALLGQWSGPRAQELIEKILTAAGMDPCK